MPFTTALCFPDQNQSIKAECLGTLYGLSSTESSTLRIPPARLIFPFTSLNKSSGLNRSLSKKRLMLSCDMLPIIGVPGN